MNTLRLFSVLAVATGVALIQSCKLERLNAPCPIVDSISPKAAYAGETITIFGSNFLVDKPYLYRIRIGDQIIDSSIVKIPNSNTMKFIVPVGVGTGMLTVVLEGKSACYSDGRDFTYYYKGTKVERFAGTPNINNCIDCLNLPAGIDLDLTENNEYLIVADYFHSVIRKFSVSNPTSFSTIGKLGVTPACNSYPVTNSANAYFNKPYDVALNSSGDIFVVEDNVSIISALRTGGQGRVDLIAGVCPRESKFQDGLCSVGRLSAPYSISVDGNNLYFADNGRIRVVELVPGGSCSINSTINIRTILPVNTSNQYFKALEVSHARKDQGPIFIADIKEGNIKALTLNEKLTTISPNFSSSNEPMALTLDSKGNIFIAANNRIYVLYTNGALLTLAGTGNPVYTNGTDGNALTAQFNKPSGLALYEAKKSLFVSDTYNHVIRKVNFE